MRQQTDASTPAGTPADTPADTPAATPGRAIASVPATATASTLTTLTSTLPAPALRRVSSTSTFTRSLTSSTSGFTISASTRASTFTPSLAGSTNSVSTRGSGFTSASTSTNSTPLLAASTAKPTAIRRGNDAEYISGSGTALFDLLLDEEAPRQIKREPSSSSSLILIDARQVSIYVQRRPKQEKRVKYEDVLIKQEKKATIKNDVEDVKPIKQEKKATIKEHAKQDRLKRSASSDDDVKPVKPVKREKRTVKREIVYAEDHSAEASDWVEDQAMQLVSSPPSSPYTRGPLRRKAKEYPYCKAHYTIRHDYFTKLNWNGEAMNEMAREIMALLERANRPRTFRAVVAKFARFDYLPVAWAGQDEMANFLKEIRSKRRECLR